MQEGILFYNGLDVQARHILDSKGVIPFKTVADAKVVIQEMAEYSQKWHNGTSRTKSTKTSDRLAAIQAQLNNLGREIKKVNEKVYDAQVGCEQWGYRAAASGFYQRNNANPSYQEQRSLPSSIEANPRDHVKSILTTAEADSNPIHHIGSPQYAISTLQNRRLMFESRQTTIPLPSHLNDYYCEENKGSYESQFSEAYSYGASHIDNSIPRKEKDPGSFTLPCYINNVCFDNALADLGGSVSVMPLSTYLSLGLGKLAHTKLIVELADRTVKYPKGIAENVLVEDHFYLPPTLKIDVFKRKITLRVGDEKIIFKSVKPTSSLIKRVYMLSLRERIELDLEARLKGETLVLNRSLDPLYGDYIELNDLNVPLELMRDQVDDMMPTIEEVVNMDGYRDQGMGDIILREPFCKALCVEARRFDELITIHNGSDNVTYQMARSHSRFKHLFNAQCNKIKSLLK
ncbi:hypothetical protein Tco_1222813, partial [Tanacetum coccineum]